MDVILHGPENVTMGEPLAERRGDDLRRTGRGARPDLHRAGRGVHPSAHHTSAHRDRSRKPSLPPHAAHHTLRSFETNDHVPVLLAAICDAPDLKKPPAADAASTQPAATSRATASATIASSNPMKETSKINPASRLRCPDRRDGLFDPVVLPRDLATGFGTSAAGRTDEAHKPPRALRGAALKPQSKENRDDDRADHRRLPTRARL